MWAGGQIIEQRKIQLYLQGANAEMQDGFIKSVRLAKLNGSYNGQEYRVWAAFKSVMGRVGRSLPAARVADRQDDTQHVPSIHTVQVGHSAGTQDDAASFKAKVDATVKAALAGRRIDEGDAGQAACNNWDYTGTCSYGDRCKFSQDAEAGYTGTAHVKVDKEESYTNEDDEVVYVVSNHLRSNPRDRRPGLHAIGWKMGIKERPDEN